MLVTSVAALNCSSDQTTLPPHSGGAYQFHRWLSVATRNNPRPPSSARLGPVATVRFAGPDRYWDGCHDFGRLSAREARRAQPARIGPRRDELGTFATLISRFVHLPPGYEEALRALGEGPMVDLVRELEGGGEVEPGHSRHRRRRRGLGYLSPPEVNFHRGGLRQEAPSSS